MKKFSKKVKFISNLSKVKYESIVYSKFENSYIILSEKGRLFKLDLRREKGKKLEKIKTFPGMKPVHSRMLLMFPDSNKLILDNRKDHWLTFVDLDNIENSFSSNIFFRSEFSNLTVIPLKNEEVFILTEEGDLCLYGLNFEKKELKLLQHLNIKKKFIFFEKIIQNQNYENFANKRFNSAKISPCGKYLFILSFPKISFFVFKIENKNFSFITSFNLKDDLVATQEKMKYLAQINSSNDGVKFEQKKTQKKEKLKIEKKEIKGNRRKKRAMKKEREKSKQIMCKKKLEKKTKISKPSLNIPAIPSFKDKNFDVEESSLEILGWKKKDILIFALISLKKNEKFRICHFFKFDHKFITRLPDLEKKVNNLDRVEYTLVKSQDFEDDVLVGLSNNYEILQMKVN